MNDRPDQSKARLQIGLIALLFAGPLIAAAFMYYSGAFSSPAAGTNNGALMQPVIRLSAALPDSPLHKVAPDQWLTLYMPEVDCDQACLDGVILQRQTRLMLANDMDRVARVFLQCDSTTDTVTAAEFAGLIIIKDRGLCELLKGKRPVELASGGIWLIDPLGNLVLYFPPDLNPNGIVDDIEHLLKLSHIG
jgi:hypothetical protein